MNQPKDNLKQLILETATTLFYQKGIRKVRMDDISHRLHISKRTLYEIYDNKESLIIDILETTHQKHYTHIRAFNQLGKNVIEVVLEALKLKIEEINQINPIFFSDLEKNPHLIKFLKLKDRKKSKQIIDFIKRGINEGYFLPYLNIEIVGRLREVNNYFLISQFDFNQYPLQEVFITSVILYVRGMCTPKGIKLLDNSIANILAI